jgi:hypothetical protein
VRLRRQSERARCRAGSGTNADSVGAGINGRRQAPAGRYPRGVESALTARMLPTDELSAVPPTASTSPRGAHIGGG